MERKPSRINHIPNITDVKEVAIGKEKGGESPSEHRVQLEGLRSHDQTHRRLKVGLQGILIHKTNPPI